MISSAQIERLSRAEKLQVMEALWEDLSKSDEAVESPPWHHQTLRETELRVSSGQENIVDWEAAKRELRNRFE